MLSSLSSELFASYPDIKGQVVLVLGAGQSGDPKSTIWGNGAAISKVLSASGVRVIACDVTLEVARPIATRIQSGGGICQAMEADATSQSSI